MGEDPPAGRCGRRNRLLMTYRLYLWGHGKAFAMPGKRTGEGGEGPNDRGRSISTYPFAAVTSLTLALAAPGQERTSADILTLDRAIKLARANIRGAKRAKWFRGRPEVWSERGAGTEIGLNIPASVAYGISSTRRRFWVFRNKNQGAYGHQS
jgi:hypothetical protein